MDKNFKTLIKYLISNKYLAYRGRPKSQTVALTFDDGPCAHNTEQILDILKEEKIKATFFLIGKEAERYPEIIKRMLTEGHEIGMHSFSHINFSKIGFNNIREEIEKTRLVIRRITGSSINIFRPPEGIINLKLLLYSLLNRIKLVQWSADISDSFSSSDKELMTRFDKLPLNRGDIILLHDDSMPTINTLPLIISKIKEKGFGFATISEFLECS